MCQCMHRNNAYENSNAKIAVIILQSTCKMQSKHAKRAKEGRVLASVPIVSQTKDKQPSCPYSPLLPFCDFLFCSPCSHHSANSCRTASRLSLISLFSLHLMSHLWLVLQAMFLELQHLVKKLHIALVVFSAVYVEIYSKTSLILLNIQISQLSWKKGSKMIVAC